MDGVETVAQKLKEDSTIPFSWKNVATYFFDKGKLAGIGYSNEKIIEILADLEIANIPLQEEQTLQEITALATDSLHKYSLVVVSHSQGGLFANLMYQRLSSDPALADKMNRYANLQVGTAAAYISAPISDYYTNSFDIIINSLRENFEVLPSNVNIIPLDSLSLLDFTQHGFVEIYVNPGTQIGLSSTTAEDLFLQKLSDLAARVVDHGCAPNEITYPTLNPDGSPGGFIGKNASKMGPVYMYDGARLCGETYANAALGKIEIRGVVSKLTNSWLVNSNPESTMLLDGVVGNYLSVFETSALYDTKLKDVTLEQMTVQDAQISYAYMKEVMVSNSILSTITLLTSQISEKTVIDDAYITNSEITGGSQLIHSTVLNSYVSGSLLNDTLIERFTVINSSLYKVHSVNSYIKGCNFSERYLGSVSCVR